MKRLFQFRLFQDYWGLLNKVREDKKKEQTHFVC